MDSVQSFSLGFQGTYAPVKGITDRALNIPIWCINSTVSFQALNEERENRLGGWGKLGTMSSISWMELGVDCHDTLEIVR